MGGGVDNSRRAQLLALQRLGLGGAQRPGQVPQSDANAMQFSSNAMPPQAPYRDVQMGSFMGGQQQAQMGAFGGMPQQAMPQGRPFLGAPVGPRNAAPRGQHIRQGYQPQGGIAGMVNRGVR